MKSVGKSLIVRGVSAIAVILGVIVAAPVASGADTLGVLAFYNGGIINMSQGWGSAQVCDVTDAGTYCFANQSEFQIWTSSHPLASGAGSLSPMTNCSSNLDLYANISYGGSELMLNSQGNWINLSSYGFSDIVSSFKVGTCSISMNDAANGSGNFYPGPTSPGSLVSWIGTAWNDRIQSVFIY